MRRRRAIIIFIVIFHLLMAGVYPVGRWLKQRDFRDEFSAMRGELGNIEVLEEEIKNGHIYRSIRAVSSTDILFSARIKVPVEIDKRLPALIILGGLRTGSMTVDYIKGTSGMIVMAIDYPYKGKKEDLSATEFMIALSGIHKAVLETPPTVILGVDYLLSRDDVDPDRITLIGGSLGAFFVPAVMAADSRIDRAAILFGAGDLQQLIKNNITRPAPLPHLASWIAAILVSPVEPLKYIGDISPRSLFILNGKADPRIPVELATRLQEAAREPKTVVWIDCEHLNVKSEEFHRKVSSEVMGWLVGIEE